MLHANTGTQAGRHRHADFNEASSLPEIQDLAGYNSRLSGLPFRNIIQKEFTVTHHGISTLPASLHSCGLWDLKTDTGLIGEQKPTFLQSCFRVDDRNLTG